MDEALSDFLGHHLETFNTAVRTGDFAALVELFANDAELSFEGVPAGPFHGRDAIAAAYAEQPPTDTMSVLDTRVTDDGTVVETFSWGADRGVRSGEMRLDGRGRAHQAPRRSVRLSAPVPRAARLQARVPADSKRSFSAVPTSGTRVG